jgi:hypothetical protein
MYLTKKLQSVNVNIYAKARNEYITTEHFPPSVVVWVNLTYILLSYGLVDSSADPLGGRNVRLFRLRGLTIFRKL